MVFHLKTSIVLKTQVNNEVVCIRIHYMVIKNFHCKNLALFHFRQLAVKLWTKTSFVNRNI